jgi:regulatory protein
MPKKLTDPRARAVALLARREHSAKELRRKLAGKGLPADEAEAAVAAVAAAGYQSDARYAAMLVRSRVGQGYGPVRIEAELEVAGVAPEQIREALDAAGVDWRAHARAAHARRFGAPPRTSAERAKQYRYLQGRGFSGEQIGGALAGGADEDMPPEPA